jgi:hypothetical protein
MHRSGGTTATYRNKRKTVRKTNRTPTHTAEINSLAADPSCGQTTMNDNLEPEEHNCLRDGDLKHQRAHDKANPDPQFTAPTPL